MSQGYIHLVGSFLGLLVFPFDNTFTNMAHSHLVEGGLATYRVAMQFITHYLNLLFRNFSVGKVSFSYAIHAHILKGVFAAVHSDFSVFKPFTILICSGVQTHAQKVRGLERRCRCALGSDVPLPGLGRCVGAAHAPVITLRALVLFFISHSGLSCACSCVKCRERTLYTLLIV